MLNNRHKIRLSQESMMSSYSSISEKYGHSNETAFVRTVWNNYIILVEANEVLKTNSGTESA